jgi:hypothetical protein
MTRERGGGNRAKPALEWSPLALFPIGLVAGALVVVGGGFDEPGINSERDLRAALDEQPYSYTLRAVSLPEAEAAFVGRVADGNGTVGHFSVSICKEGDGDGCPAASLPNVPDKESGTGYGRVWLHDDAGELIPGESGAERQRRLVMLSGIDMAVCYAVEPEYGCAG